MAEKGIDIETVQVDLGSGEQFSEWFRKLNPDCVVPVLELDDGTILTEVLAICDYLESQFPEPPLMGRTPVERATVLMWNAKVEQLGLAAMAEAFRNSVKGLSNNAVTGPDSYPQIAELAARGRPLSEEAQYAGQRIGILMLVGLMGLAFYNDIARLVG